VSWPRPGAFDTGKTGWGEQPEAARGVHVRNESIVHKPTSMLPVVPQPIRSDLRFEVKIAVAAPGSATTGQDA
jgi:hypothetical protein